MNENYPNQHIILSYLYHRASDLNDAQAYELLGDFLSNGNLTYPLEPSLHSSKHKDENLLLFGESPFHFPFGKQALENIPSPPAFLIQDVPNEMKALEFYQQAVLLGNSDAALKAARLTMKNKKDFPISSKKQRVSKYRNNPRFVESMNRVESHFACVPDCDSDKVESHQSEEYVLDQEQEVIKEAMVESMLNSAIKDANVKAMHVMAKREWDKSTNEDYKIKSSNNHALLSSRESTTMNKKLKSKSKIGKSKAFALWLKAAEFGDILATKCIAECYRSSEVTDVLSNSMVNIESEESGEKNLNVKNSGNLKSRSDSNTNHFLYWSEKAYQLGDTSLLSALAEGYRYKMLFIKEKTSKESVGKKSPHTPESYLKTVSLTRNLSNHSHIKAEYVNFDVETQTIIEKGLLYTKKAAQIGDPRSLMVLAYAYSHQEFPWTLWHLEQDISVSIDYLLEAFDAGQENALSMTIGLLYEQWKIASQKQKKNQRQKGDLKECSNSRSKKGPQDSEKTRPISSKSKAAILKNRIHMLASQFHLTSTHVKAIILKIKETLNENGYRLRIRSQGSSEDVFRAFMKMEETIGLDADAESEQSEVDDE